MMEPVKSIQCFDAMVAATRRARSFSVADIAATGFSADEVRVYLKFCMSAAAVEVVPERSTRRGRHVILYRTKTDIPPVIADQAAASGTARIMLVERIVRHQRDRESVARQSNLWTALRVLRVFEPRTLAFHARTEAVSVSPAQARNYLRQLSSVGYLSESDDGFFRLIAAKNTGPSPILFVRGIAFDLNLMRSVNVTGQPRIQHDGRAA